MNDLAALTESFARTVAGYDSHTYELVQAAIAASSMSAVALQLDRGDGRTYSRTAISLYMSGKYGAEVGQIEEAIRARYDLYICPHTGQDISGPDCHRRANAPRPFGGKAKELYWLACQGCAHHNRRKDNDRT